MRSFLKGMLSFVLDKETNHPIVLTCKAQEELGEFSEAMLKFHGYLRHKDITPEIYNELADVFMVLITAAAISDNQHAASIPVSPAEVVDKFEEALKRKFQKYKRLIEKDGT